MSWMNRWFGILAAFFCPLWVHADELVLKDGKKIEWKTLNDEGDVYEVITPQGTKLTVKKDDVERLAKTRLPEVLTGAQFAFDKKRKLTTLDLLARVDTKRDGITGTWKQAAGAVVERRGTNLIANLAPAYTPPEEFDVTVEATRKEGLEDLVVGLIGGGKQF